MSDVKTIRIKYFTDKIERLTYIGGKSDWIDLRAAEEVSMKAGEFRLIPLGVAMELPKGYEAHVVPRSSTFKSFRAAVHLRILALSRPTTRVLLMRVTAETTISGLWPLTPCGIR